MVARSLALSLIVVFLARDARAEDQLPGHTVNRPVDGGIQAMAFGIGLAAKLIPPRERILWTTELIGPDEAARANFSRRAAHLSDAFAGLSMVAPVLYLTGTTIDDADGDRLLLYGQAMAVNVALVSLAKQLVQRPRPYMYSKKADVLVYGKAQGTDGYLSFYSGHSAISFGAATTGAYLLGASGKSSVATSFAWGGGFAVAAMTANLRVRAGKHFYSDVVVGSLVGMTVGYLVPALHADDKPYVPSGDQLALAGAGVLAGLLVGQLIPLEREKVGEVAPTGGITNLTLTPTSVENGMGFGLAGGF